MYYHLVLHIIELSQYSALIYVLNGDFSAAATEYKRDTSGF